jgi:NifU-like protein involved in Fe-S cluster formation
LNIATTQSLYSRDVLRLAMALPHDDRLDPPCLSATARAPLCGSEMSVEIVTARNHVTAFAIRARACALGQASAAIVRTAVIGRTAADIEVLASQVEQALKDEGEMPEAFAVLAYARDYPARHGAILLPFETILAALAETKN